MLTLADLKGKRLPAGYSAMRTLDRVSLAMLATAGLTLADVRPVMVPNVIRGAERNPDDQQHGKRDDEQWTTHHRAAVRGA